MNPTAFVALVRKDLQLFFTDRRSMIMCFVAPILIASFFGFVLDNSGGKKQGGKIPIALVDLDQSEISKAVAANLAANSGIALQNLPLEVAREGVKEGDLRVAAILPQGFGERASRAFFGREEKPEVGLLYDPSHGAEKEMIRGVLTGEIMQTVGKEMFSGASGSKYVREALGRVNDIDGLSKAQKKTLRQMLEGVDKWNSARPQGDAGGPQLTMPYTVKEEAVMAQKNAEWNSWANSFAGFGVQFAMFMGIEAGVSILLQRQRGLWKRFRAAPVSKLDLLGSRAASAAICGLLILAVMFTFGRIVFNVRIDGSFAGFVLISIAFSLMTACFGLLIASFGGTPEATRPLAILVTLILVMLGGSWIPTFLFPAWLQKAALIVPTRWANDGLNAMTWRGLGFSSALLPTAVLLGFAALFGFFAVRQFRWEVD